MEKRPKILIVNGYHPKEIFAVQVGEHLLKNNSNPDLKVVKYTDRSDSRNSTYRLRRFVEKFDPVISPIILHGDDEAGYDGAIIYSAKSKQEGKITMKPLLDFCFKHSSGDDLIVWGRFFTYNTKYSIIDIELNSIMGLQKAVNLINNFSQYLIDLYLNKGIKL